MVYIYMLKSSVDESYYVGISENVEGRVNSHNLGKVHSTRSKRPWVLVYTKEHLDYKEARRHEKWLKKKSREYKNKLTCPA